MAKHNATGAMKEVVDQDQKALAWAALVLKNQAEERRGLGGKDTREYVKRLRATAKRLRQMAEPRWIPVGDRLPEEGVDVLVCESSFVHMKTGETHQLLNLASLTNGCWSSSDEGMTLSVTHWMPLPEPPAHGEATEGKG